MNQPSPRQRFALNLTMPVLFGCLRMVAVAKDPVPPSPTQPWAPPQLGTYERELARRANREKAEGTETAIDPQRMYHLPELIDIAERNNPETRTAWERARQAAAAIGISESLYFPYLGTKLRSKSARRCRHLPQIQAPPFAILQKRIPISP